AAFEFINYAKQLGDFNTLQQMQFLQIAEESGRFSVIKDYVKSFDEKTHPALLMASAKSLTYFWKLNGSDSSVIGSAIFLGELGLKELLHVSKYNEDPLLLAMSNATHFFLAVNYLENKQPHPAKQHLEELLKLSPENAAAKMLMNSYDLDMTTDKSESRR